jgi:hypothetical protein
MTTAEDWTKSRRQPNDDGADQIACRRSRESLMNIWRLACR